MNPTFKVDKRRHRAEIVVNREGAAWVARELIGRGAWFEAMPVPFENVAVRTRDEQANTLRALAEGCDDFNPNPEEG